MTFAEKSLSPPKNREDLKAAVEACIKLSAVGDCSTGPYGSTGEWDVSHVTDMRDMFNAAKSFNQKLSEWKMCKETTMDKMFAGSTSFNQDLSEWNVGKVTSMSWMFFQARAFNQDLSKWNVGQVANMEMMFNGATSFKQTLCGEAWVNSKANKRFMFDDSGGSISCERFQPQDRNDLKAAVLACFGR